MSVTERTTATAPSPAPASAPGIPQVTLRIGGKGIAVFLAAEQIEPLSRDQPEPGITGIGDAARQIDRVVAAELGPVDIRMGDKGRAIALVAEAPDRAGLRGLELRQPHFGSGIDEIGDRVEPLDGEAGVAVDDDPLGGRGRGPLAGEKREASCRPAGRSRQFRGKYLFRTGRLFFPAVVPS